MKEKRKFRIGSQAFFGEYPDYESKDQDFLYIMDGWDMKAPIINFRKDGIDRFFTRDVPKEIMIAETLSSNQPLRAGKFLVPEFAEYMGMTIDDLKRLEPLFEQLDEAHGYEKVIYDAYVENDAFTLTDEQRLKAYEEYKKNR